MLRLRSDRLGHAAGTIVYECGTHDYGLASDDSRYTGIEHISVTLDPEGGYPFFTVPLTGVEKVRGH
jgi:hypothetical protein